MNAPTDVLLEALDVTLEYDDGSRRVRAVDGVSFTLARGMFLGLVGPSGSGKSSLMFLLAGLRPPSSGEVRLLGKPLPASPDASASARREHVGFLFQEPFLVPYLSVRENALGHTTDAQASARLDELAAEIGMADKLEERPHRLSGGERQRASLLRALANDPELVLADEPTANLDQTTGRAVIDLLRRQTRAKGLLVVTHDPSMLTGADRVLFLRDGRLVEG
ncbi:MAG: ABC transporter ATP-binding protein [Planctomycetota bacterium]|nr:ABC transporter ATP-binding protein [Planctomycetota bacterium]